MQTWMPTAERQGLSSRASPQVLAELRKAAAKGGGRQFQPVLEEALRDYIARKETGRPRRHAMEALARSVDEHDALYCNGRSDVARLFRRCPRDARGIDGIRANMIRTLETRTPDTANLEPRSALRPLVQPISQSVELSRPDPLRRCDPSRRIAS